MTFFVDWDLWIQMSFCLGGAIVLVFIAGLIKLWWITRRTRKQILIDREKRARLEEMRRTGLETTANNKLPGHDVPFGVRAIQSGVEIEGIWISRPNTPINTAPSTPMLGPQLYTDGIGSQLASSATLVGDASSGNGKGKGRDDSSSTSGKQMQHYGSSSSSSTSSMEGRELNGSRAADAYTPRGQADGRSRGAVDTYVPSGSRPQNDKSVHLHPLNIARTSPTNSNLPAISPQGVSPGSRSPPRQYPPSPRSPSGNPQQAPLLGGFGEGNDLRQPDRTFGPGDTYNNSRPSSSRGQASGSNKLQKPRPQL